MNTTLKEWLDNLDVSKIDGYTPMMVCKLKLEDAIKSLNKLKGDAVKKRVAELQTKLNMLNSRLSIIRKCSGS